MPNKSRELLRASLSETRSLGVSPEVADVVSEPEATGMLLVIEALRQLRHGQENTQAILSAQNTVLATHTQKLDLGEQTMQRIDKTTQETNGKVKVLRSEMDNQKDIVGGLMKERTEKILQDEADRLRKEGMLVIPRRVGGFLKWCGKWIYKALAWLGAIAIAWPALVWLWTHRPF